MMYKHITLALFISVLFGAIGLSQETEKPTKDEVEVEPVQTELAKLISAQPVSYTHLTLPTICSV